MNYPTKQQAIDFANYIVPWYNLDEKEVKYFRTSYRQGKCVELVFIDKGKSKRNLELTINFRFFEDGRCIFIKPNEACELDSTEKYNEYCNKTIEETNML